MEAIRKQINIDIDERVDISSYKSKLIDVIIKNCDAVCPKCKQENVNCQTKQLRSADEGATNIYTCLNCGYKWSVNN